MREERTLIRRERLAAEASGEGQTWLMKTWTKIEAVFRPIKLLGGIILMLLALLIWTSMLITAIDKAKNSVCKVGCGYLLGHINIFQPVNWILVISAKVFPIDYIIFLLLILFLFCASVVGLATVGIRFLWLVLFKIRRGHTSPQALLMATVMLTLIVLAINYSVAMIVAPQYATFGPQTYCDRPARHGGEQPDCSNHRSAIKPCSELADNPAAREICTPSVVSTFLNRVTVNFPFFGVVTFWAQFVFLGAYLIPSTTFAPKHHHIAGLTCASCSYLPRRFRHDPLPRPEARYGTAGRRPRRGRGGGPPREHRPQVQRHMAGHHRARQEEDAGGLRRHRQERRIDCVRGKRTGQKHVDTQQKSGWRVSDARPLLT